MSNESWRLSRFVRKVVVANVILGQIPCHENTLTVLLHAQARWIGNSLGYRVEPLASCRACTLKTRPVHGKSTRHQSSPTIFGLVSTCHVHATSSMQEELQQQLFVYVNSTSMANSKVRIIEAEDSQIIDQPILSRRPLHKLFLRSAATVAQADGDVMVHNGVTLSLCHNLGISSK